MVRNLIKFCQIGQNFVIQKEIATKLMLQGLEFDTKLDTYVTDFVLKPTKEKLTQTRNYIVKSSHLLPIHNRLILIAELVQSTEMTQDDAAITIASISSEDFFTLSEKEQSIIEIARIVVEDSQEKILGISDDAIFKNKLLSIL